MLGSTVNLFAKLSLISIREIPQYPVNEHVEHVSVDVDITKSGIRAKQLKGPLDFEKLTVDAKIPAIIEHIDGPTVIYTEYVREIIDKISNAVRDNGYSCAEYWGEDHSGLRRFKEKEVQVLVASQPASTGVDGLQDVCHNLIISSLPWTNARYQQLVGRLVRLDQKSDVTVHIIKAKLLAPGRGEYEYDENKWIRILNKRALADCAVIAHPHPPNTATRSPMSKTPLGTEFPSSSIQPATSCPGVIGNCIGIISFH